MEIVCLDMEGTLTPEIWERVALNTGIEELGQTTRDIPSYEKLMDMRLQIMSEKGIMPVSYTHLTLPTILRV